MRGTVDVVDPFTGKRRELFSYLAIDERRERNMNRYLHPRRQMDHFELSDRLRQLEKSGVQVPTLTFSNTMPFYVETTEDGVEIYQPGNIRVPADCVIDSHGNVVNLHALQQQAFVIELTPRTERTPRYDPSCIVPLKTFEDSRAESEVRAKYADIFGTSARAVSTLDVERILHPERHPDFSKPTVREYLK
ncbi:hypothetical protein HY450_01915 [Candidatus Pacearchaeota archaeon]|nr:hypothetical protein [Candidatus Pacearchaeota archaeon]